MKVLFPGCPVRVAAMNLPAGWGFASVAPEPKKMRAQADAFRDKCTMALALVRERVMTSTDLEASTGWPNPTCLRVFERLMIDGKVTRTLRDGLRAFVYEATE